ncbi:MAG: carbohydrate kinase [Candidatus Hydrogenedentes bacterium]|nr:carbohydrate kinase [Candidatus Hydrogenedentota bacterium]
MQSQLVQRLAAAWRDTPVGVVGDLMLDRYVWGTATRISQEAPIPVVRVRETTVRPGGAANVMYNVKTLGARPVAFGVLGQDSNGALLSGLMSEAGVDATRIVHVDDRSTTEKSRIIAGNQQVVRVDTEFTDPLGESAAAQLHDRLLSAIDGGEIAALIIEDYAKGTISQSLVREAVQRCHERRIPVALDPHPANVLSANGLTLITPNRAEAFAMAGFYYTPTMLPLTEDLPLLEVAQRILNQWAPEHLLITLGADGMALFSGDAAPHHVPTRAREVFDVSGAGDTVIASFTLALAAGASAEEAAVIANHAAGVVVGKVGTAPVHLEELIATFDPDHHE